MAHRITLLALEGCFGSNVVGAIDMFGIANLVAARMDPPQGPVFQWQVLSPTGRSVRTSNGYELAVDGPLRGAPRAQIVMIPAFGSPQPDQHVQAVQQHAGLGPWLREQHAQGATLAASCSGSFLLAEAGLLDERRATTSWWLAPLFATRYARVQLDVGAMVTECDRLVCGGTGMSHLDVSLHLIERCAGRPLARLCAKYAVLDNQRRSQAPYIVLNHARRHDPVVTRAEKWARANLRHDIGLDEMAGSVAVSPRTLARHFKQSTGDSPQVFVQKLRVETGKALLESTRLRLDAILERIGYADDRAFRRLFRRHTGLSPREYRSRFGLDAVPPGD